MTIKRIQNGKDYNLVQNPPNLPQLSQTLDSWLQPMIFNIIAKSNVDYMLVETLDPIDFQGVWQCYTDEQLQIKPEGQRSWKWYTLHSRINLELDPDDIVEYQEINYRVMMKIDQNKYGFYEFHLIEDYDAA